MNIKRFKIKISQGQLDDLNERIKKTIWPAVIGGQNYGGPKLADMMDLAKKALRFDWRKKETEPNKLPHFKTEIDGQTIHFIHVKSRASNAIPLMLIHGWPGSFVEFVDHIEPLTDPVNYGGGPRTPLMSSSPLCLAMPFPVRPKRPDGTIFASARLLLSS